MSLPHERPQSKPQMASNSLLSVPSDVHSAPPPRFVRRTLSNGSREAADCLSLGELYSRVCNHLCPVWNFSSDRGGELRGRIAYRLHPQFFELLAQAW